MTKNIHIDILRDRGNMLHRVRRFFHDRGVLEVDCPILSQKAPIETHIDIVEACCMGKKAFLHSSPEYGMKRLLADGIGDIYQLSHVFRDNEVGRVHNPEFMMAEWYRMGYSLDAMIEETVAFIRLFIGEATPYVRRSYRELFQEHTGMDTVAAPHEQLLQYIRNEDPLFSLDINRDSLITYIFTTKVEPCLDKDVITIVDYFPKEQAALAEIIQKGDIFVAERFEAFYGGLELANGYHELRDPKEQLFRLETSNTERKKMGKEDLPIDTFFIEALSRGIGDCSGVACGFDRLLFLRHDVQTLSEVMTWAWDKV